MSNNNNYPMPWINDLRLEGHFCDAVIKVGDVEFKVHKVILCNCSPYFRALFLRWATPEQKVFNIPGLSPGMMEHIIDFAYTGSVSLPEVNLPELFIAADQFNVMGIVQSCCDYLEEQLCPQNCIGIWHLTNVILLMELRSKVYRYIIDHFEEVILCEEFLQLSVEELDDFLMKDDLRVRLEESVFDAIIRWINHAPEEREGHISLLFSKVRLPMISREIISGHFMSNDLVRNDAQCREIIEAWVDGSGIHRPSQTFMRLRLPSAILFAVGGWIGRNPSNSIEAYDYRADQWLDVTNDAEPPRAYHGTVFLNGFVYCIGGFNRIEYFNSVRRLDLSEFIWHEAAPMNHRRCYVSTTVLDGFIYALGGHDGHNRLNTAERYNPETNQWSLIAEMNEQRSDASCTTLNSKIYICGGFDGHECLQTCEYYTPETNQWTAITPMLSRRTGVGVVAHAGRIYAVGGFNGISRLRSAEYYNPQTNTWHRLPTMLNPRSNFGIGIIDDRLFVVGGFNGIATSNNVEYYDVATNVWTAAADMGVSRSAESCCVVYDIPDIARFTRGREL